ncbi:hypothetical protein KW782_04205 [Candidatus Parcubacteria bacterium]|nr:hypothetical protein [Candidatus Parcubacteria bacterium]
MSENEKDNIYGQQKAVSNIKYNPVVFRNDHVVYILFRRLENVAAAVFLVSQNVLDSETLKGSLRKLSLDLISRTVSFISSSSSGIDELRKLLSGVLELTSQLKISEWSGIISKMNADMLQKELRKAEDTIVQIISSYSTTLLIDPAIFKDIDLQAQHLRHIQPIAHRSPKTTPLPSSRGPVMENQEPTGFIKKNERRDVILKLLAEKNNLSIKDFAGVIKDYSEKTIQRELLALVEEGMVKKQGERRWSTYSLAR